MQPGLDVLLRSDADVGEGPVWDEESQTLVWVDITRGLLHTTTLTDGHDEVLEMGTMLGAVALADDGRLVAAVADGLGTISRTEGLRVEHPILADPRFRMNDAACDRHGRFFAGSLTMDFEPRRGRLHMWRAGSDPIVVLEGLTQPNGLAWSPDDSTFYLVDTVNRVVFAFDYHLDDGQLSEQRVAVHIPEGQGEPDGLCVDADGCLWLAMWGAGHIRRYDPHGREIGLLRLPVSQPTCPSFLSGNTLVVTSARAGLDEAALVDQPLAGSVFAADVGVPGIPTGRFSRTGQRG